MFRAQAVNLSGSLASIERTAFEIGGRGQPLLVMLGTEAELESPIVASGLLAGTGLLPSVHPGCADWDSVTRVSMTPGGGSYAVKAAATSSVQLTG
jgi:hypothetical protein